MVQVSRGGHESIGGERTLLVQPRLEFFYCLIPQREGAGSGMPELGSWIWRRWRRCRATLGRRTLLGGLPGRQMSRCRLRMVVVGGGRRGTPLGSEGPACSAKRR